MSGVSSSTIQGFKVRAVRVPMAEPHQTASGVITESPLVLTDVVTDAGVTGHGIVFTYTPAALEPTADLIRNFEPLVKGDALDEGVTWVEEPTLAHDYAGHALVAREVRTPIQCGENWWGILNMQHSKRTRRTSSRPT